VLVNEPSAFSTTPPCAGIVARMAVKALPSASVSLLKTPRAGTVNVTLVVTPYSSGSDCGAVFAAAVAATNALELLLTLARTVVPGRMAGHARRDRQRRGFSLLSAPGLIKARSLPRLPAARKLGRSRRPGRGALAGDARI
jgi:hypothetical protein